MLHTTMPTPQRKRFLLHARTEGYQTKVIAARERVARMLATCQKPYVAFSGGKDSHCVLALVREVLPNVPAVYFDADCAYPEVLQLLAKTSWVIKHPATEPFLETLVRLGLTHPRLEAETMRSTVYEPISSLMRTYRFDGVFYGLRADESAGRRKHAARRGAQFTYATPGRTGHACQPIHDWNYLDVWAFIVTAELPYCETYNLMWDLPESDQRISYYAGETKRRWGRYARLKQFHPELFNRVAKVLPEVRHYV